MRISRVQIFNLASALVGMMVVDKLGRRKIFLISNIGMLIGQCCSVTLN
jgi:MFS family permease